MLKKGLIAILALAILTLGLAMISKDVRRFFTMYASGSSDVLKQVDFDALSEVEQAAYLFLHGDFGALSTDTLSGSATPWMLTATVITLDYVDGDVTRLNQENLEAAFRQWGIASPHEISNWPNTLPQPHLGAPVGLTIGKVERTLPSIQVTAANIGCAMCHSSVVFDADGYPDPEKVWIGAPNGSVNLEAYPQAIYRGFLNHGQAPDLLDHVTILFPDITETERKTLQNFVLPRATKRIAELEATTGRAVPFKGGYPGLTNGFDALQIRLGLVNRETPIETSAFNSIPNLEDHALRTGFLNAASYEIPGFDSQQTLTRDDVTDAHLDNLGAIVAYFTVPSMGLDFATAAEQIPDAQTVMRFVAAYDTPAFPGEIDAALAAGGRDVYNIHCASCHGTYADGPNGPQLESFPNHVSKVGTDELRLSILTPEFANEVNRSPMGQHILAPEIRGYSAPSLSGVWLSAPYFHNGSVPTLWALMTPSERPLSFPLGGHKLDYEQIGIALQVDENGIATYPDGYQPWSMPVMIDTRRPGLSNTGHEAPFDRLSEAEKWALLEYLKTL
ncbi:MAG: hypothetical protein AAF996_15065 [Pseudomonadota bacterium]